MKRLCVSSAKQAIAFFVFMIAAVLPLYGQQSDTTENAKQAGTEETSRFALSAGGTPAIPGKSKSPAVGLDAERATDSRFARDEEAWAGPLPDLRIHPLPNLQIQAVETPAVPEAGAGPLPDVRVHDGETPALLTPALSGNNSQQTTNQTTNQTTKQTTDDAYVFPTPKERFNRYVKSTVGPFALFRVAASAGIGQWRDKPEEWEQGMSGYGKRLASSFGRNAIQQTVTYGLDSALGWDTGFRRSKSTEFRARLKHALLENITSRTKSGKRVISVPRITGAYASGVISTEAWYPERYNYKDGLRSGTNMLLMGFALNLVREFVVPF